MLQMLDRLADCMMFGALEPCEECPGDGQLVFRSGVGYQCMGDMSEWTKCQFKTLDPKRKEFKLPKDYKQRFDFCKLYKCKVKKRAIPNNPSTVRPSALEAANGSNG